MIVGVGIDIIELNRIAKLRNNNKFINRILTEAEQSQYKELSEKRQIEFLAGRFAAKEAFSKAVGTGIGKDLSFKNIEVSNTAKGRPIIVKPYSDGVHLSISHSSNYAVAHVIIEKVD